MHTSDITRFSDTSQTHVLVQLPAQYNQVPALAVNPSENANDTEQGLVQDFRCGRIVYTRSYTNTELQYTKYTKIKSYKWNYKADPAKYAYS